MNVNSDPSVRVEPQRGGGFRISQTLKSDESPDGLQKLMRDGVILSYTREGNELVVFAPTEHAARHLASLGRTRTPKVNGLVAKAREVFVPPNLPDNCAPEYLKFRAWCLGSAVAGGAIGFMNISVNLDALKIAFDSTQKAALAQTINSFAGRFATMGASFLAQKGDADPRKFFLISSLVASTDALLSLGVLSTHPTAYWPLTMGLTLAGAVAGCLGGAAGVNIFNHMAKGPNKGLVAAKNGNQDLVAGMLGMPVALGLSRAAEGLGVNPYLFTVATMGPVLAICTLNAANSIRLESVGRARLEQITDHYLTHGATPEAPRRGMMGTLSLLWEKEDKNYSSRIRFVGKLQDAAQGNAAQLYSVFREEKYLLSHDPEQGIKVVLRKDAELDDIMKAYAHARLVEQGEGMLPSLRKLSPDNASENLVELAYRALPATLGVADHLIEKGWHASAVRLGLPRVEQAEWGGPSRTGPALTAAEFRELAKSGDLDELRRLLGTSDDLPLFAWKRT